VLAVIGCGGEGQKAELPIEDDFSGDCQWSQDKDEDVSLGCEDGQYRVLFKSTERTGKHRIGLYLDESVDSEAIEADVTLRALPGAGADDSAFYGLACMVSPRAAPSRGYVFFVGSIGSGERGFAIVKIDETDESLRREGFYQYLADEQSDAVAGTGETNHLRGECRSTEQGVELAMYLNGKQVGRASDPNGFHPFDGFALLVQASGAGTDVRYDNFKVEEVVKGDSE